MIRIVYEKYQEKTYQDFVQRLASIESTLVAARLDFDPALTCMQIEEQSQLPTRTKHAGSLYRVVGLLRTVVNGPVQEGRQQYTFFPKTLFYNRLNTALPELDVGFKLLLQMSDTDFDHDESFLLGILVWELLQSLNPRSCKGTHELWENLYHRTENWRIGFTSMPKRLLGKVRSYFYSLTDPKKETLLERIPNFRLRAYLQTEVTPQTIQSILTTLCSGIQNHMLNGEQLALDMNADIMEAAHQKRVDVLNLLLQQVDCENAMSADSLARELDQILVNILDCFDSPVSNPNPFVHLEPADKLRFIFDACVFSGSAPVQSELKKAAIETATRWIPNWVQKAANNYLVKASPGTVYARSKLPEHEFTELNANLYNTLNDPGAKKSQYKEDARRLITHLLQRLDSELSIKRALIALVDQITAYQLAKAQLAEQVLDLVTLLTSRVEQIVQYKDCSESVQQFSARYQIYFGAESLEIRCQLLHAQLATIEPLNPPELNGSAILSQDIAKAHAQIDLLKEQNNIMSLATQFSDLLVTTQRFESQYQQELRQLVFPQTSSTWRAKFPYVPLLTCLLAAMGLAISIGIVIGNPYFAFLVLPCLIEYTIPICLLAMTVGTVVLLKSGMELSRYQFFGKSLIHQDSSSSSALGYTSGQPR